MTEPKMVMKMVKKQVDSKKFVELWIQALKDGLTRNEFYALVGSHFPSLLEKGIPAMKAKMYAINATIKTRTGGKKLRYPPDPDSKKGAGGGEFRDFIIKGAVDWDDAGFMEKAKPKDKQ